MGTIVKGCLIALAILIIVGTIGGYLAFKRIKSEFPQLANLIPTPKVTQITFEVLSGTASKPNNSVLQNGDSVTTNSSSEAKINFPNGSEVFLSENTTVKVQSPESLLQTLGRSWTRITKLTGSGSFEIETPTTVASVRGTEFAVDVTPSGSSVATKEGTVEVAAIEKVAGKRQVIQKISVDAGNTTRITKSDLQELKANRKQLIKEKISNELESDPWFKRNLERTPKSGSNVNLPPIPNLADIDKLKNLATKAQNLTPEQRTKLEALAQKYQGLEDPSKINPADLAQMLAIIDPQNFSDTEYWTKTLGGYLPYLKNFVPKNNNSSLFNELQNLPALGVPEKINITLTP